LAAPHLMPFEVANIVRRLVLRGVLDDTAGSLAVADVGRLAVDLAPYQAIAERVWELRVNLTAYDAAYVATAELVGGRLVTLDERLARAPGIRCEVATPP
ncbi:MAG: type II toxin-antitoxin system VapC family toxin, partial [Ilumatobacter sp.]|nr:type II toxin-antitoxin system VapC family toxin [Ilumatobacter sp.]